MPMAISSTSRLHMLNGCKAALMFEPQARSPCSGGRVPSAQAALRTALAAAADTARLCTALEAEAETAAVGLAAAARRAARRQRAGQWAVTDEDADIPGELLQTINDYKTRASATSGGGASLQSGRPGRERRIRVLTLPAYVCASPAVPLHLLWSTLGHWLLCTMLRNIGASKM